MVTAIILTKNEEIHIERAVHSVLSVVDACLVVDSGSTDKTVEICERLGAKVVFHPWVNYASQFNWALSQLSNDDEWVIRLDADEYLTETLAQELTKVLHTVDPNVSGISVNRFMCFMEDKVRFGGVFPIQVVRAFRRGHGYCEERWMDEHIKVSGRVLKLKGSIIDDNKKPLTWWIEKHNLYASREAVDILCQNEASVVIDSITDGESGSLFRKPAAFKRFLKEKIYNRMPTGFRAFLYFFFRFFLCGGIFDSKSARSFHILQGFWYRYLVDLKVDEVRKYARMHSCDIETALKAVLNIDIRSI